MQVKDSNCPPALKSSFISQNLWSFWTNSGVIFVAVLCRAR